MARPGLLRNRKFLHLERCPGMTRAIALGSLELIWSAAYETGDDVIGTPEDVEMQADWRGDPGSLFASLRDCGFIEESPGRVGLWRIHDLYDHAPDYVQRRMEREAERIAKGQTISEIRAQAAKSRWDKEKDANECKRPSLASGGMQTSQLPAQPAPSPLPAQPAPAPLALVAEADASDDPGPFGRVAKVWTETCVPVGFAKPRATSQQKKQAAVRCREPGWFEAFEAACRYIAAEPFYRGGGSSGWVATLGWLLEPGHTEKTADRAATKRATPEPARQVTAAASDHSQFQGGKRDVRQ